MTIQKTYFIVLLLAFSSSVSGLDCSQYIGRGYCTDYIRSMTGKSQSGDAGSWAGNISSSEVLAGDVAIFTHLGTFGHVALVDGVNRDSDGRPISVNLSEWNYGAVFQNENCAVTNNFGVTTIRNNVAIDSINRFWRPSGVGSGSESSCKALNSRYSICWTGSTDASCEGGKDWVLYDFGTSSMVLVSDNTYCPIGRGGGSEPSAPKPLTGGTNPGSLPNLIPNNSDVVNAVKAKVTTLHIKEAAFCKMQTKNVGKKKAGAFERFDTTAAGMVFST